MAMAQATRTVRVAQISGKSQQHGGHYNNYKLLRESCTEHTFCLDIEWTRTDNYVVNLTWYTFFFLLNKEFIYLFLERGREGEREGEKHQCVVASHAPAIGDLDRNPGMCPDWESNQRSFGSQAHTQSTLSHTSHGSLGILPMASPKCIYLPPTPEITLLFTVSRALILLGNVWCLSSQSSTVHWFYYGVTQNQMARSAFCCLLGDWTCGPWL